MNGKVSQLMVLAAMSFASGTLFAFLIVDASKPQDYSFREDPVLVSRLNQKPQVLGARTGINILYNGTVYWLSGDGTKKPYPNQTVFQSWGHTFSNVQQPTAEEIAKPTGSPVVPKDGTLINDRGTVYIIEGGKKSGFTSLEAFQEAGYSYNQVLRGDIGYVSAGQVITRENAANVANQPRPEDLAAVNPVTPTPVPQEINRPIQNLVPPTNPYVTTPTTESATGTSNSSDAARSDDAVYSSLPISILTPTAGETLYGTNKYRITWTGTTLNTSGNVSISIYRNDSFMGYIVKDVPNNGSYEWPVPYPPCLNGGKDYCLTPPKDIYGSGFSMQVELANGNKSMSQKFNIYYSQITLTNIVPLPVPVVGQPYRAVFGVNNAYPSNVPYIWTVSGLCCGITSSTLGGAMILESPSLSGTAGTYTITMTAKDIANQIATATLSIVIPGASPTVPTTPTVNISTTSLLGGQAGTYYNAAIAGTVNTNQTLNFSFSGLPAGVSASATTATTSSSYSVNLVGAPQTAGTYTITMNVTSNLGATASKQFALTIGAAPIIPPTITPTVSISTTSVSGGRVGTSYSSSIAGSVNTNQTLNFSFSGLPAGVSASATTATTSSSYSVNLVGTPQTAGIYTVTLNISSNLGATTSRQFSLSIEPAQVLTSTLNISSVGSSYSSGQSIPISWSSSNVSAVNISIYQNGVYWKSVASGQPASGSLYLYVDNYFTSSGSNYKLVATSTSGAITAQTNAFNVYISVPSYDDGCGTLSYGTMRTAAILCY